MSDKDKENKKESARLERLRQQHERDMEIASILMKADDNKEETLDFGMDGQVALKNEIADLYLEQIDNPEEKYNLYYNVTNRLLQKHLPKGDEYKEVRDLIYEEKNVFLTRGHRKDASGRRGMDGRMAYVSDIGELIDVVTKWITSKGTSFNLYMALRDLNSSKGY